MTPEELSVYILTLIIHQQLAELLVEEALDLANSLITSIPGTPPPTVEMDYDDSVVFVQEIITVPDDSWADTLSPSPMRGPFSALEEVD